MPIYEYKCEACDKIYEELVTGDRDKPIPCPACGSGKTQKLMSVIGAISVGSSSSGGCVDSCANAPSCAMAGGGGCPGMCHG